VVKASSLVRAGGSAGRLSQQAKSFELRTLEPPTSNLVQKTQLAHRQSPSNLVADGRVNRPAQPQQAAGMLAALEHCH
ncbi:MAG: hypothetical protein RSJ41_06460, partial [Clostridia bacterium]